MSKPAPLIAAILALAAAVFGGIWYARRPSSMIRRWLQRRSADDFLNYMPVSPDEAQRLKMATGRDFTGFTHRIDRDAVKHAMKHGKDKRPVTQRDIKQLPCYILNAQTVRENARKGKLPTLEYHYTDADGETLIVEEIRTGWKRLAFKTMYKK
ncbi:MAG: hypothetical protein LBK99_08235 [Opitutaceae bacterium]|jgi:hypothetical protein|nr:hypothetical protein [Opitutaceae bacterium]